MASISFNSIKTIASGSSTPKSTSQKAWTTTEIGNQPFASRSTTASRRITHASVEAAKRRLEVGAPEDYTRTAKSHTDKKCIEWNGWRPFDITYGRPIWAYFANNRKPCIWFEV